VRQIRFEEIRGQERAISSLRRSIDSGRTGSAYLFLGPPGVGKRATAVAFAAALDCEAGGTSACGECRSCTDAARGAHPDISIWGREENKKIFGIPRVREIIASMAMKAYSGPWKVTVVDEADTMNDEAANAFLHTLEEPPPGTVLILTAANARALPETISSRCQAVMFQPLADQVVADLLVAEGIEPDRARDAALMAEGSLDLAREMLGEAWLQSIERAARWSAMFGEAAGPDPLNKEIASLTTRDDADRFLAVVQGALRASVRKAAGLAWSDARAGRKVLGPFAAGWPLEAILTALRSVDRYRRDLKSNLNPRIVVENFAMDLYVIRQGVQ
jgi:DNA polymerase-3 subunit delta'